MREKEKVIVSLIVISIIIIFCIIVTVIFVQGGSKDESEELFNAEEGGGELKNASPVQDVDSSTMMYTVENIVKTYAEYLHFNYEKPNTDSGIKTLTEKKEAILKLLDINYIKENKITENNLEQIVFMDNDELKSLKAIEMKQLIRVQFQIYSVHVQLITESGKRYDEYYVVTLDEYNSTCMIKPIADCSNIDEIQLQEVTGIDKIEENEFNIYSYIRDESE